MMNRRIFVFGGIFASIVATGFLLWFSRNDRIGLSPINGDDFGANQRVALQIPATACEPGMWSCLKLPILRDDCNNGDGWSCLELARIFMKDGSAEDVNRYLERAKSLLIPLCEKGDDHVCFELGTIADDHGGAKKEYFSRGCRSGNGKACYELSQLSPAGSSEARVLLEQAKSNFSNDCSQHGDGDACFELGKLEGQSGNVRYSRLNMKKACKLGNEYGCSRYYEKREIAECEAGNGVKCYNLAMLEAESGELFASKRMLELACKRGICIACRGGAGSENPSREKAQRERQSLSKRGLLRWDRNYSQYGYTLVNGCTVIDMDGTMVHKFPGFLCSFLNNGEIVSSINGKLVLFDHNGIKWKKDIIVFHELSSYDDGSILVTSFEVHPYMDLKVRFDNLYKISREGKILFKWSTFDHIEKLNRLKRIPSRAPVFRKLVFTLGLQSHKQIDEMGATHKFGHLNSAYLLQKNSLSKEREAFRPGNILMSFGRTGFLVIMDSRTFDFVWVYHQPGFPLVHHQHAPTMLANGNILMYINHAFGGTIYSGYETIKAMDYSSAVEIDPVKKDIVWQYGDFDPGHLRSQFCGSAQRLSNGNILMSGGTNGGRVIEVTPQKKIVWEWVQPENVYRAQRVSRSKIDMFLRNFQVTE